MVKRRVTEIWIDEYHSVVVPEQILVEYDNETGQWYLYGKPVPFSEVVAEVRKAKEELARLQVLGIVLSATPEELREMFWKSQLKTKEPDWVPRKDEKPTVGMAKFCFEHGIWKVEWGSPLKYGITTYKMGPKYRPDRPYDWAFAYYNFWNPAWGEKPKRKPPEYDYLP